MRNIDSKSRPRTQFRFKYLAVRIRLLRLGGSLTTFSTVSVISEHFAVHAPCPGVPPKADTLVGASRMSALGQQRTMGPTGVGSPCSLTIYRTVWCRVALAARHFKRACCLHSSVRGFCKLKRPRY